MTLVRNTFFPKETTTKGSISKDTLNATIRKLSCIASLIPTILDLRQVCRTLYLDHDYTKNILSLAGIEVEILGRPFRWRGTPVPLEDRPSPRIAGSSWNRVARGFASVMLRGTIEVTGQ